MSDIGVTGCWCDDCFQNRQQEAIAALFAGSATDKAPVCWCGTIGCTGDAAETEADQEEFDRMLNDIPEDPSDFGPQTQADVCANGECTCFEGEPFDTDSDNYEWVTEYVPAGKKFLAAMHEAGTTYSLALTALLNAQNGMAGALIIDRARVIFNLASDKYTAILERLDG